MKVGFAGKGGAGKTTTSVMFTEWVASVKRMPTLAIDSDINQHMGEELGLTAEQVEALPKIGTLKLEFKEYVRGENPYIKELSQFSESTPPGLKSRFFTLGEMNQPNHPFYSRFSTLTPCGARFVACGNHTVEKQGQGCHHNYTASMAIYLNHLLDGKNEFVVCDMVAGSDPFSSSGLGNRVDVAFLVVEPTRKALEVFKQAQDYLAPFGMQVHVIGNKIENESDVAFIKEVVGDRWVGHFTKSEYIRNREKGIKAPITELEEHNKQTLEKMFELVQATPKDWAAYYENGLQNHRIVQASWGERWLGVDPMTQVDPEFSYDKVMQPEKQMAA